MKVVRHAIEIIGATPLYLPTYSPELNPIELWWNDLKRCLRKLAIDMEPVLRRAARRLRAARPLTKIPAWFAMPSTSSAQVITASTDREARRFFTILRLPMN